MAGELTEWHAAWQVVLLSEFVSTSCREVQAERFMWHKRAGKTEQDRSVICVAHNKIEPQGPCGRRTETMAHRSSDYTISVSLSWDNVQAEQLMWHRTAGRMARSLARWFCYLSLFSYIVIKSKQGASWAQDSWKDRAQLAKGFCYLELFKVLRQVQAEVQAAQETWKDQAQLGKKKCYLKLVQSLETRSKQRGRCGSGELERPSTACPSGSRARGAASQRCHATETPDAAMAFNALWPTVQ